MATKNPDLNKPAPLTVRELFARDAEEFWAAAQRGERLDEAAWATTFAGELDEPKQETQPLLQRR